MENRNCWKKSGILPEVPLNVPAETSTPVTVPISSLLNSESAITSSLDQLEARGLLQRKNRMDIEELLNPRSEQEMIAGKGSEEGIFKSVQDMVEAEQMMEVNGGYDIEVDEMVQVKPTRKEALTAAFTLQTQKYIANINEPFTRKLEGTILTSFGHQTRLESNRMMETTHITDYFTQK